jgi:hypothetical protein
VLAATDEDAVLLRREYRLPPHRIHVLEIPPCNPSRPAGDDPVAASRVATVTALGPKEAVLADRPRQALGLIGRTVFGRHSPAVQTWLTQRYRTIRRAMRRALP